MNRFLNRAALVALSLLGASAAPAADFHPEDAACRPPCEVHDTGSKAEAAAPRQAQQARQQVASELPARKQAKTRGVSVAQTTNESAGREPSPAHERATR